MIYDYGPTQFDPGTGLLYSYTLALNPANGSEVGHIQYSAERRQWSYWGRGLHLRFVVGALLLRAVIARVGCAVTGTVV